MPASILWELIGQTGTPLICTVTERADHVWQLTIIVDRLALRSESFFDQADAVAQANLLRAHFADGWQEVARADVAS